MKQWYKTVKSNITKIPDFLEYYEKEYLDAKEEVKLLGSGRIDRAAASLPHLVEHRYSQLQDIEAVLEYLNIQYRKVRSEVFQKYFENQKIARALSAKECEKYVDGDSDVNDVAELVNDVAYIRNQFLAILKGFDNKGWQLSTISRLRTAGIEDATI